MNVSATLITTHKAEKNKAFSPVIDIVLATYQGEKFLSEQIQSIQNNVGYSTLVRRLFIVDDGSTDGTEKLVKELSKKDSKLVWFESEKSNLGPMLNFQRGIELTKAPLIMLSDQDDVWCEHKIIENFTAIAPFISSHKPALVFSDMEIVDQELNLLCDSYFSHKRIPKNWHQDFSQLLQQNTVSGCSSIFNRALINYALPFPKQGYMHDWWLAVAAKCYGELIFLDRTLLKYRQHNGNAIGAKNRSLWQRFHERHRFSQGIKNVLAQAKAFELHCSQADHQISHQDLESLQFLCHIEKMPAFQRIKALLDRKLTRSHIMAQLALTWVVLFHIPYDIKSKSASGKKEKYLK